MVPGGNDLPNELSLLSKEASVITHFSLILKIYEYSRVIDIAK